jgi:hypothetical protein
MVCRLTVESPVEYGDVEKWMCPSRSYEDEMNRPKNELTPKSWTV